MFKLYQQKIVVKVKINTKKLRKLYYSMSVPMLQEQFNES